MSNIALEFGGTIDKYIGDAIMIFFGDPDTRGEKAGCPRMRKNGVENAATIDGAASRMERFGAFHTAARAHGH